MRVGKFSWWIRGLGLRECLSQRMRALDWVFPCHEAETPYAPRTVAGGFFRKLFCVASVAPQDLVFWGDRGISMTGASNLIPRVVENQQESLDFQSLIWDAGWEYDRRFQLCVRS